MSQKRKEKKHGMVKTLFNELWSYYAVISYLKTKKLIYEDLKKDILGIQFLVVKSPIRKNRIWFPCTL